MATILISTIYKGTAVIQATKLFTPNKIYFIIDDPIDDTRKNSIQMIKELFPDILQETISAKIYDMVEIAKSVMDVIEKEKGNKIIVHISEGRKTMSLGLLFGAYVKKDLVDSAYYITEEANTPIKLPMMDLKISTKKSELLKKINNGIIDPENLGKELNIQTATVYVYMKELRDSCFLNANNQLTEMGRIVLFNIKNE